MNSDIAARVDSRSNSTTRKVIPLRAGSGGTPPPRAPLPRHLTQEELQRFRRAVLEPGRVRDIAMFGLMYRLGLRACEVVRLQLGDLDLGRARIRVHRAKQGHSKEYLVPRDLRSSLRRWLRHRRAQGPFLFTGRESTNQRGLSVLRVQQLFKAYAAAAGLAPEIASHSLRHSIAVHALDAGFGLEHVQDLLGHTSIRSTAIYARVSSRARDAMMATLDDSAHVVAW